jgi:hypothetical protein
VWLRHGDNKRFVQKFGRKQFGATEQRLKANFQLVPKALFYEDVNWI